MQRVKPKTVAGMAGWQRREENMDNRIYIAIDLKSFYASAECVSRGLDPLTTNLVVADVTRTEKTICLAVSPSLKSYGIPGRARLFEVVQKVREANRGRARKAPGNQFTGSSYYAKELALRPDLAIDYIAAPPRMAYYMQISTQIYNVYLRYVASEDIHVYSIDEVFIDVTSYLRTYKLTPRELAARMIEDVLKETGITATAGIGTNLYLCKVAMDIVAKHVEPDKNGVRIAYLDEQSYKEKLWNHRPLTDFWRVGRGYEKKLQEVGLFTMGDVARCSLGGEGDFYNEDLLYKIFGVNAELLIDHAWGYEPVGLDEIKAYKPRTSSLSSGQVLQCPYDYEKTRVVVQEMADAMALDLVEKKLLTSQIVLTVGYDIENLQDADRRRSYHGEVTVDRYGRKVPKHAHGTANLLQDTSSSKMIVDAAMELFDKIVDPALLVRRLTIDACKLVEEGSVKNEENYEQLSLFTNYAEEERRQEKEKEALQKERKIQEAMLSVKKRYGKNAILKGSSLTEGATAMDRNNRIGGHHA